MYLANDISRQYSLNENKNKEFNYGNLFKKSTQEIENKNPANTSLT